MILLDKEMQEEMAEIESIKNVFETVHSVIGMARFRLLTPSSLKGPSDAIKINLEKRIENLDRDIIQTIEFIGAFKEDIKLNDTLSIEEKL